MMTLMTSLAMLRNFDGGDGGGDDDAGRLNRQLVIGHGECVMTEEDYYDSYYYLCD